VPGDFGAWATVGLHPHDASEGLDLVERVLEEAVAEHPGVVVAVGECGLDYHYDHSPRPAQREMFAAQVALARRFNLTLVVHTRQAWDDTFAILEGPDRPAHVVMHCFTGGPDEARRCLDLDAFLSFSGIVTFKNATDVRAAAALCPLDRLLVETDAPFLAPVPHRGEDNRPALVPVVGAAMAAIKAVPPPTWPRRRARRRAPPSPCPDGAVGRRFSRADAPSGESFAVSLPILTVVDLVVSRGGRRRFSTSFPEPASGPPKRRWRLRHALRPVRRPSP